MNPEYPNYDEQAETNMELRAHHLFTLSVVRRLGAHKNEWRENFAKNLKASKFSTAGRERGREFTDHMVDSVLDILKEQVGAVKITDTYDKICEKCPERKKPTCRFLGREGTENFLSLVDQSIVKNTNGMLELGKEYSPAYLIENIDTIRRAMRKTLLELPGLFRIDKKLQKLIEKEEREK